MSEEPKKSGRGGWRGGGRPRKNRTNKTFSLDPDCIDILRRYEKQSDFVNAAIRYYEANVAKGDFETK